MQCNIMMCAHNNIVTHSDVTLDIHSNIITYYDVIMGHGTCPYVIPPKSSAQNGISTGDRGMEIQFKTVHSTT